MHRKKRGQKSDFRPADGMQTLLTALSLGEAAEKIQELPDGRARALLRQTPYLALELEKTGEKVLARLLSDRSETVFDLAGGDGHAEDAKALEALRERIEALLTACPAPSGKESEQAKTYRLKVSVLEDFTYLPRWQELGHTDVSIGGDPPPPEEAPSADEPPSPGPKAP